MRVALFHDYLNQFGGGERVFRVLTEMFPHSDIYTLLYDEKKTFGLFEGNGKVHTSFLDRPFVRGKHRAFIPLMPLASGMMKVADTYDLVISSSAGYAKGFGMYRKESNAFHICYCHSPLRYAWEIDYLKNLPFAPRSMSKGPLRPIAEWLRRWDRKASTRVNLFIANSHFIAEKINAYYDRDAEVVYPPVDLRTFFYEPGTPEGDYCLMVGRMLYYKGFDLGIRAFNRMKKKLVVIGRGPEERKLRSIANPQYIEFVSAVSDEKLRRYYHTAKALIFPQIEDFGLVAAEAQACGLPVIAFSQGGGGEIVADRETGIIFTEQTAEAIIAAVREFETKTFDRKRIAARAERFSEDVFRARFTEIVRRAGFRL